jgi:hypothetical protein
METWTRVNAIRTARAARTWHTWHTLPFSQVPVFIRRGSGPVLADPSAMTTSRYNSVGFVLMAAMGLLLAPLACSGTATEGQACAGPSGSITDLASEPRYQANYLHRWTTDGCLVRLDVLMTRTGGCGPEDMLMGTPLGASTTSSSPRIYVRGDTTAFGGGAAGYNPNATLPASAVDTGFRQEGRELWIVPGDDSFVFVRSTADGHVEAWPRDLTPIGCV